MEPARPRLNVAIGIVVEGDRVLIARRPPHVPMGGLWEFPGGKQEPGETPEQTAVRELKEEVGLDVTPTGRLAVIEHDYAHASVRLTPVLCRRVSGEVVPHGVSEARWVPTAALSDYAFPPANTSLLRSLAAGGF